MIYEQQILKILMEVGERGIHVAKLSKHVFNMNCTLFVQPDLEDIHRQVQQYLLRNSKSSQSLIEHMEQRGYYRLNMQNSPVARQLMLDFSESIETEEPEPPKPQQDFSLSLFD